MQTIIIRILLALAACVLIVEPAWLMFSGMPVWFGVAQIVGQFAGFILFMVAVHSRCWE